MRLSTIYFSLLVRKYDEKDLFNIVTIGLFSILFRNEICIGWMTYFFLFFLLF